MTISIITVCLNAEKTIEETLASVTSQDYPNIEYLVIDGKSTDATVDIIKKHKEEISFFISEPDKGIYHAMNKAILKARGKVLYFLNSDDTFCDQKVVSCMAEQFQLNPDADVICGTVMIKESTTPYVLFKENAFISDHKNRDDLLRFGMCHQRMFANKSLYDRIGYFNTKYRCVADWEWFVRAYTSGADIRYIRRNIALYRMDGYSSKNYLLSMFEKCSIVYARFPFRTFLAYVLSGFFKHISRFFLYRNL